MISLSSENYTLTYETKPILVHERDALEKFKVTIVEGAAAGGKKLYKAKVAHADRINANARVYPSELWQANLTRLKPKLADGYLGGAIDHAANAGNLNDTCLIWRDLWMESDGAIMGMFEIIDDHSKGKDFRAQIAAGLAVGFSTSGYGSAHEPSAAERLQYGLGDDTAAVIMDANYMLKKIDAVDDPSVEDARLSESMEHHGDAPADEWEDPELRRAQERVAAYYAACERRR